MSGSLPVPGTTRIEELLLSLGNLQSTGRQNSSRRWSHDRAVSTNTVTPERAQFKWKRKGVVSALLANLF